MGKIPATETSNRFGQLVGKAMKGEYERMDHELEGFQNQRLTESIEDMKAGRTKSFSEVFSTLKERYLL